MSDNFLGKDFDYMNAFYKPLEAGGPGMGTSSSDIYSNIKGEGYESTPRNNPLGMYSYRIRYSLASINSNGANRIDIVYCLVYG